MYDDWDDYDDEVEFILPHRSVIALVMTMSCMNKYSAN